MRKISKRDQDPKQVEQDAAALAAMRENKSQHFALGSTVLIRHLSWGRMVTERAVVTARPGNGFMIVEYEGGTWEILRPPGLSWERE